MIRRREVIAGLGATAAWPLAARAQQAPAPVIGFLSQFRPAGAEKLVAAFRQGLAEDGYLESRNVAVEFRWAEDAPERLPELAADLVRRRVAVIVTPGGLAATRAAQAATTAIPIVFSMGSDPVQLGFVASLDRPGGNLTGFTALNTDTAAKRLGLLRDLVPGVSRFAFLVEPSSAGMSLIPDVRASGAANGLEIDALVTPATDRDLGAAFASLAARKIGGLFVSPNELFYSRRAQLAALARRYRVPVIYWDREFAVAGGLMSYGSSETDLWRQVAIYAGRILKGEKPGDLPVQRAAKFQLVLNLQAAKSIGLTVPTSVLATADEVIE